MALNAVLSGVNIPAILVAGIVHMVVGLIWFSQGLFGRQWERLTGQTMKPDPNWLPAGAVGHLVIALMLAVVVSFANATTAIEGAMVGILMWLGFVVTLELGELIWEKIPFRLFTIRIGNHFLALSAAGAILGAWR